MASLSNRFTRLLGIEYPIIGGAMYPCSNPELVASVSEAGGIGIVQPVSLTYVHKHEFRAGLRYIRSLTKKPIGLNLLIEKSSEAYLERNRQWLDIALEEGVRFFITALGNPDWVMARVKGSGSVVFHDVTERRWADKALSAGVHGLICVNNRAGGHAGRLSPADLYKDLADCGLPLICAGGVGSRQEFLEALQIGYDGVQMGTRFIASAECHAHEDYKQAILNASAQDIVLTEKLTGVPVSVIRTDYIKKMGVTPNFVVKALMGSERTKRYVRLFYTLSSLLKLKKSLTKGNSYQAFYQAGKSVEHIHEVWPVAKIIQAMVKEPAM